MKYIQKIRLHFLNIIVFVLVLFTSTFGYAEAAFNTVTDRLRSMEVVGSLPISLDQPSALGAWPIFSNKHVSEHNIISRGFNHDLLQKIQGENPEDYYVELETDEIFPFKQLEKELRDENNDNKRINNEDNEKGDENALLNHNNCYDDNEHDLIDEPVFPNVDTGKIGIVMLGAGQSRPSDSDTDEKQEKKKEENEESSSDSQNQHDSNDNSNRNLDLNPTTIAKTKKTLSENNSNDPQGLIIGLELIQNSSDNVIAWIISEAEKSDSELDLHPYYLAALAERILKKDQDEALFLYIAGILKLNQDMKICKDETVERGGGLQFTLAATAPNTHNSYIAAREDESRMKRIVTKVLKWNYYHSPNNYPHYAANHGLGSYANFLFGESTVGTSPFYPKKEWPNIIERARKELVKQLLGSESKKWCKLCGKETELKCGRCKRTFYCGQDCQKQDWAKHKKDCKPYQN